MNTAIAPIDILETADRFVVQADLPGVSQDQVEIELDRGRLHIRARSAQGRNWERALLVREAVDSERLEASLTNGVLTITLPKPSAQAAKRIPVRAA